jgi:hypothetical protein
MFGSAFRTEKVDDGSLPRVEARLAGEIVVLILTLRAGQHHETTSAPRQERNRIEKTLAEIPTMSYT